MKRVSHICKYICVTIVSTLISVAAIAQDTVEDIDMNIITTEIDKGPYYTQLWFWIVLGLVFLLLLIALLRGSGSKKIEDEAKDIN